MLTLHHLNDSRSQRVLWLLEKLGLPYEMKRYQRDAVTRPAFQRSVENGGAHRFSK
ncbi:Glutathione S-transferase, N-terminal domain [Bradyrhizobium erythrophlei]|jgi:glutathione S-transferase|nr:Glutathione S-transferase, N-terminal domain [Bradyrhizobium erythrophlei]